jgi:hypothetical protein
MPTYRTILEDFKNVIFHGVTFLAAPRPWAQAVELWFNAANILPKRNSDCSIAHISEYPVEKRRIGVHLALYRLDAIRPTQLFEMEMCGFHLDVMICA